MRGCTLDDVVLWYNSPVIDTTPREVIMASRTYATGSFRLVLDKASAPLGGFTESGGLMTTKWTGTTLKALNKELATAINFGLAPRSVQAMPSPTARH
jgi:hypothetical protein